MKKPYLIALVLILVAAICGYLGLASAQATKVEPGSTYNAPITVTSESQIPQGAYQTGTDVKGCNSITRWTYEVPENQGTVHEESRYLRDHAEVDEVNHKEYRYERDVYELEEQWLYVKYTQTREGHKTYASDEIQWDDFGPWTEWSPRSHYTWSNLNQEAIGDVMPHASWTTGSGKDKVYYERVWQLHNTGESQENVISGPTHEVTDWLTEAPFDADWPWTQFDVRTVIDQEGTPAWAEYYVIGGPPTLIADYASWVDTSVYGVPDQSWTEFEYRTVANGDATPGDVVYFKQVTAFECNTPERPDKPEKPGHPNKPGVPTTIDAGL